jgi:RHS repeat-associated protein/uncharacterized repeat protein (TIGR01451 family)
MLAASKAGDDWSDASGIVGKAQLTYGHVGCNAVDINNQCTGGAWPKVTGAEWVWSTKDWSPSRMETTFTKSFQAGAGPGVLHVSADNIVVALLNGNEIVRDVGFNGVRDVSVTLQNGQNTLVLVVRNFEDSHDPNQNPAGVAWSIEGPPFSADVVADAGADQTVPEGATVKLDGTKSSASTTTPVNEPGGGTAVTGLGGQIFSTGGPVEVQVLPASAGITSELWLFEPIAKKIGTNRDVDQTFQVGSFPAGAELVFGIKYDSTEFRMGPGDRNPDGIPHAVVTELENGKLKAGFEDLFGGGDRDYDDNLFEFRGGIATEPPVATYHWQLVDSQGPPVQLSSYTDLQPVFDAVDDGTYTFRLTVSAGDVTKTDDVTITVTNVAPRVGAAAAPTTNDGMVMVSAQVTDAGIIDTHSADIAWGDGTTTANVKAGAQGAGWAQASAAHVYNAANTYEITVTLKDDDGGTTVTKTNVVVGGAGVPKPVSGLALWANDPTKGITFTGSDQRIVGLTHSNGFLNVGSTGTKFDGTTEYGTTLSKGKATFKPVPVKTGTKPRAVNLPIADYQPGGRAAKAAGTKFFDMTSACKAGKNTWQPKSSLKPGVYWAPCDVQINGGNYAQGKVTIAASGTIKVTCGSRDTFTAFIDQALFISSSTSSRAIDISGSYSTFAGFILANNGGVEITGSNNEFDCAIVANEIKISGARNSFDTMSCGFRCSIPSGTGNLSDGVDVAAPPLLVPNLQTSATGTPAVLPNAPMTVTATASNNGATVVVPGLVAMANGSGGTRTMNGVTYSLEVADANGVWSTMAITSNGTARLTALGAPANGATYGGGADIIGTKLSPNAAGVWATTAVITLDRDQVARLLDAERTTAVRSSLIINADSAADVRQTSRFGLNIAEALRTAGAGIVDTQSSLVSAAGVSGPQAMGPLASGSSSTATFSTKATAVAPKGANETDAGYTARLVQADGSVVGSLVKTQGVSAVGPLYAPTQSVNAQLTLPILSPVSSDLAPVTPGSHVDWTVDVSNMGRAQATNITVGATANGAPVVAAGVPSQLNPSSRALVTVPVDVPTTFTNPFMNVSVAVNWKDAAGNAYGPVSFTKTLRVVQPAALRVLKGVAAVDNTTITYSVSATNSGDSALSGVVITDTPDANTRIVPGSVVTTTGTATVNDGTISIAAGTLPGRAAVFVTYKVDYTTLPIGVTTVTNQATVTSNELQPTASDDPNVGGPADPTVYTFTTAPNGGIGGTNTDPTGPKTANITPADGTIVTKATPVTAAIAASAGRTITTWSVLAYPAGGNVATAKTLASGVGTPPATLATLDPSLLSNGIWTVRIASVDNTSVAGFTETSVVVDGEMKLGRFSATYNDLSVPVGGLPIDIQRTYDSIDRNRVGDFGNGWNVGLANFRVQTNRPLGAAGWERYSCGNGGLIFVPLCYKTTTPHFVTVTWPDGHTESFDFTPKGGTTFFPMQASASYTARAGARNVTSTLSPMPDDESAGAPNPMDGNIYEGGFGDGSVYNPTRFLLTDKAGTKYVLDTKTGLVEMTDRNNNKITVDSAGVHSSNGVDVAFVRDALGRITKADGPGAQDVNYGYSVAGDLVSVTNAEGATSTYTYDNSHNMTASTDFTGRPLRSMTYDVNGRLSSVTDANGNTVTVASSVTGRSETVTDALGKLTTISTFSDAGDLVREDKIHDGRTDTSTYTYDAQGRRTSVTDPLGRVIRGTYDAKGNLTSVTDAMSNVSAITYGDFANPLTITDASGAVTALAYDDKGNLASVADAMGKLTKYAYDDRGNRTSTTDRLGAATTYTFDDKGRVLTQTNTDGGVIRNAYDAQGRVATRTDAAGMITTYAYNVQGAVVSTTTLLGTTTYDYDVNGRLLNETDVLGKTTGYGYDAIGQLTSKRNKLGHVSSFAYDRNGQLLTETNAAGNVTTYTYDGIGQLATVADPLNRKTTYSYDNGGRVVGVIAANGGVTRYTYNGNDEVLTETDALNRRSTSTYDQLGHILSTTDALNATTRNTYDALGRLTSTTDPLNRISRTEYDAESRVLASVDPAGARTTYTYDAMGRQKSVTDSTGRTTSSTYDPAGRLTSTKDNMNRTSTYEYDTFGRMLSSISAAGVKTTFTYDALGRQLTTTDALGNTSRSDYDAAGQLTASTDARNNATAFTYDKAGRQLTMTDALGAAVSFNYDAAGQQTAVTDPKGIATTKVYDALGNVTRETNPARGATNMVYDLAGQLTQTTDARNVTVRYGYDAAGRQTSTAYPGGSVTHTFDSAGQRTRMVDPSGTTNFAYSIAGDLSNVAAPQGTVSYTYDTAGRRATMTAPGNRTIRYGYDTAGELSSVTDWNNAAISLTRDADGKELNITRPNGTKSDYGYDAAGRLTTISHARTNGTQLSRFAYTLDANGNRTALTSPSGNETYAYDNADRLTNATYGNGATQSYTYDLAGNRLSVINNGTTQAYVYDAAGRLTKAGSDNITYDAAGNTLTAGTDRYTWDWAGRMATAEANGTSQSYTYDGDDIRTSVRTGTTTVPYVWDRAADTPDVVRDSNTTYLQIEGEYVGQRTDAGVTTYGLNDALGSVRSTTNATGAITGTRDYDTFGTTRASTGTSSIFGYTGEQSDPTGLIHLRARQLDTTYGRFLSSDSYEVGATGTIGYNRYTYAANNPVNAIDPSGHMSLMTEAHLNANAVRTIAAAETIIAREATRITLQRALRQGFTKAAVALTGTAVVTSGTCNATSLCDDSDNSKTTPTKPVPEIVTAPDPQGTAKCQQKPKCNEFPARMRFQVQWNSKSRSSTDFSVVTTNDYHIGVTRSQAVFALDQLRATIEPKRVRESEDLAVAIEKAKRYVSQANGVSIGSKSFYLGKAGNITKYRDARVDVENLYGPYNLTRH